MLVFVVTKNIRRYCGLFRLSGLREGVAITGLKPIPLCTATAARLKSCSDTKAKPRSRRGRVCNFRFCALRAPDSTEVIQCYWNIRAISPANTNGVSMPPSGFRILRPLSKQMRLRQLRPMLTRTAERDHNESSSCSGSLPSNASCRYCR